jgi:hypothetical protein
MKKLFTMATLLVIASWCVVNAQQQEPSLKPSVSAPRAEPSPRLLLEVMYNPSLPPGYSSVNGPQDTTKWIWVTRFIRLPGSQPSPPIQAVKLEPQFNGETADVRVTLLRGVAGFDREDLVGVYRVGVGEQKTVTALRAAGIEPFTITLVNTVPPIPPQPSFDNNTKAIEIVSVQAENMPRPAYRITLRNLSDKSVLAVRVATTFDGRRGTIALFSGDEGRPLMEVGGTVEKLVHVTVPQRTVTGFTPGTAAANTIHIETAVFSDLSFEGAVEGACIVETIVIGRKVWLTQILPLLDRQLSEPFTDHIEAARQLREKVEALNSEVDYKASSVSPQCIELGKRSSITPKNMKLQMLRDLDQIISTRPAPPVNVRAWLETRRATYKAWLARL